MANVKITDLLAYTDAASTDVLPIVDLSNNVTKKVSISDLLKAAPLGSAAAPAIAIDNDPNTGIYSPGADQLAVSTVGTERARIDSSGRLLVGTSSSVTGANQPQYAKLQVVGNTLGGARAGLIALGRSAAASTIVAGDGLGGITFGDNAAGEFAYIFGEADGTAGTNDYPGRLVFSTTADGAASPTERMRIKSNGTINFSNVATYADNAAATSGGLVAGDVYRTSTGQLMIRY